MSVKLQNRTSYARIGRSVTGKRNSLGFFHRASIIAGLVLTAFFFCYGAESYGQAQQETAHGVDPSEGKQEPIGGPEHPLVLLKHMGQDQAAIWTSPFKVKPGDLKWIVPLAGITTGLIMTDRTASHEASRGSHVNLSKTFSDAGLALAGGSSAGLYLLGRAKGDLRLNETGVLGGEAMVNGLVVDEVLKHAFQRQRPAENGGAGRFFQTGSQNSFPSAHATLTFAFASVVAHEYPSWLTDTLVYGGASAISLARVTGKQHFPSDVFVGGVLGYLIGRQTYSAHHDQVLDKDAYGRFSEETAKGVELGSAGSTFIELDSWIYPAMERLIAVGAIKSPFLGLRPWTRTATAQMLAHASLSINDSNQTSHIMALYSALRVEFAQELGLLKNGGVNQSVRLESLYSGISPIAGTPLNDSYHFGQTIINNFGRPYWQGFNAMSGFTSRAESGHFFFYARGEYQESPGAPAYQTGVRNVILQVDQNCLQPAQPCPQPISPAAAANQFRLLDTYVGFTALGNEISVGKQSLWWSAGESGAMIMSDNAEPIYMLRVSRTVPLMVPFLSKLIGPMRYDNFFGKLSGHHFPPQPFFYGDKVSFAPTRNLEFGFSRTAVFAGQGLTPLTFSTFVHSFFSTTSSTNPGFDIRKSAGARHGSFDFSYKLPFLRNWITIYADSIVHDDVSPVDAPRRAGIVPGIYISHFPRLDKLDLRVESGYTDVSPIEPFREGKFIYWESFYRDAYTNKGNLMGSWIGRQGKGTQVWSNYWLGPSSAIQVSYRNAKISPEFIPGGGTQNDYAVGARLRVRENLELRTNLQFEQWNLPVLAPNRNSDFVTSVQLTFWPKQWIKIKPDQASSVKN